MNRRKFLTGGITTIALSQVANAIESKTAQSQSANLIGGAAKIPDRDSSSGYLVSLTQPGHGISFTGVPAGNKLAIYYASLSCLLYTSPSPRDRQKSRMPSSA